MKQKFDLKVVFLGDAEVGKTTIISRYRGDIIQDNIPPTLSAAMILKTIEGDQGTVRMQIWDTAG